MWRVWVRRGECIGSWWGNRREKDNWVNNTGTKYVGIIKQTAFWRGTKKRVYTMFKIFSTCIC
jgi:hypothetical protein